MTTWPIPSVLHDLLPPLLWTVALLLLIAGVGCVIGSLRQLRRPLVYTAGALLAATLILALVARHPAPFALQLLIGIAALALAVLGGSPVTQLVIRLASKQEPAASPHDGIFVPAVTPQGTPTTREVLRGGTTIGYLERLAAAGTIMAGFPEGLAVLIAIKGVGRFTELGESEAQERFIIGTLTSILWACVCAAVFRLALG